MGKTKRGTIPLGRQDRRKGTLDASVAARLRGDVGFRVLMVVLSFIATVPLALILVYIVVKGASSINWHFITELPKPMGEAGGGISNAIVGTVILVAIATVISVPLGVIAGIFLSERSKSRLGTVARLSVETLMGIPSIVLGIVAYTWIVRPMGHFSAISGGVSLAMIMLPVITLSTEETPPPDSNVAAGGGARPWRLLPRRTVMRVILPAGMSDIITGVLLAVARVREKRRPCCLPRSGTPSWP